MKFLWCLFLLPFGPSAAQNFDLHQIRKLYHGAAEIKQDAMQLNQLMLRVDSGTGAPVMICYKGANEMIQAKYLLNPFSKFEKFLKGKQLIEKAISRDTLNLEMRFIRYSIQTNLPAFLAYHDNLGADKQFLLVNTWVNKDAELKGIIINYLSTLPAIKLDELKQLKN